MKTALSIAGSDPSGGAGIQADIKTMTMNGVYAMSAITALTAQNTTGVWGIQECEPEFLMQQIDAVFRDIYPDAVKIGMVSSSDLILVIADKSRDTAVYDGSLALGYMMLKAHELGVGSCWIHRAKEEFESEEGKAILRELGIEVDYEGIGHCVLGYADGPLPEAKERKQNYVYYVK